MTETLTHFVNGEAVSGDLTGASTNPSNTDEVVARYPRGDASHVDAAVKAAQAAFPAWSQASPEIRSDLLDKVGAAIMARAKDLGTLLAREEGKTLAEGTGEVMRAARILSISLERRCAATAKRSNPPGLISTSLPTARRSACSG